MKNLLLIGLCVFSFGTFAQTDAITAATGKHPVEFKTMVIERIDIPYDSKEPFTFEFTNTGSEPVNIINVVTSCGCTKAKQPTEAVEKGKSSEIVVNYNTTRVGPFTKTITVSTDVSAEPIVLTITGNVLPGPPVEETAPVKATESHEGHNH